MTVSQELSRSDLHDSTPPSTLGSVEGLVFGITPSQRAPARSTGKSRPTARCRWETWRQASRVEEILRLGKWRRARLRFIDTDCDYAIHRPRQIWRPKRFGLQRAFSCIRTRRARAIANFVCLCVEDEDGHLLSVIWGISCHPTEWPQIRELSSDFPAVFGRRYARTLATKYRCYSCKAFAVICGPRRPADG